MQEGVLAAGGFLALLIGIVAGLRTMTALAAASWAAHLGRVDLSNTWLAFLGYSWTPWILTVFSRSHRVCHRSTPLDSQPHGSGAVRCAHRVRRSRRRFDWSVARVFVGGVIAGIVGAIIGTFGGGAVRGRLAAAFGSDSPAAFLEDAVAVGAALLIVSSLPMSRYDAIIIGVGQAGSPLAGRLTQAGLTVAIVERKLFGGTCVNTGCMPTKTLVASAYAAHLARRSADYGIVWDGAYRVDMPRVKARADSVSGNARRGIEEAAPRHDRLPCARRARPPRGAGRRSCRR